MLETTLQGLTSSEVTSRLAHFGHNTILAKQTRWWHILGRQLRSSFIYLLLSAATLSFLLGNVIDGNMIILFVTINAGFGFFQEYRSHKSLQLLKQYVAHHAKVRRNGKVQHVDSAELVPGDIVLVETGDRIPADLRFIKDHHLMIDEEVLTGESVPINKQSTSVGFASTTVTAGQGEGVVIATGNTMQIGNIAKLTTEVSHPSGFEKSLNQFSRFTLWLVTLTLLGVIVANVIIKGSATNMSTLFVFAIALAVSVIPEALPVVTTFAFSRGALQLAKKNVIVRRLSAVQDLGSIEVLCSDKTGTLTENKLAVVDTYGKNHDQLLYYANLGGELITARGGQLLNPFDRALFAELSTTQQQQTATANKIAEIPFDPDRRRNSVLIEEKSGQPLCLVIRGAPENVCPFVSHLSPSDIQDIEQWIARQGLEGRRVLMIAIRPMPSQISYLTADEEENLTLLGLVSFADPIKPTAKTAIQKAENLGVHVKILTGDAPEVAGAVGRQVGLISDSTHVLQGPEFAQLTTEEQFEAVGKYAVFARVSPQQKYKIIKLLQRTSQVGFLGEGINDAPALKAAHVALAVPSAADITRDASDIILLEKSLLVVIDGIEEGRKIFANVVKYIRATLSANFGNFYAVAIASLFIDFLPMLPVQILLVNLLSDLPMIAIATDTVDNDDMRRPSHYRVRDIALFATLLGLVSTLFDFLVFGLFFRQGAHVLQTNWFVASIITELAFLFSIRTRHIFWRASPPSATVLWLSTIALIITVILPYTALGQHVFSFEHPSLTQTTTMLAIVVAYFAATESAKLLYYRTHLANRLSKRN